MKVLFLHGWNSVPGGVKPIFLARHGHEVINPKLPDEDFTQAIRIAQASLKQGCHHLPVRGERPQGRLAVLLQLVQHFP